MIGRERMSTAIFLNLEQENKEGTVRLKVAAHVHLICWLKEQCSGGERILKARKTGGQLNY
jgi:tRNA (Thr-GGU) A37 N-methylase